MYSSLGRMLLMLGCPIVLWECRTGEYGLTRCPKRSSRSRTERTGEVVRVRWSLLGGADGDDALGDANGLGGDSVLVRLVFG